MTTKMLGDKNRRRSKASAVNGECCLPDCANPFDLAIFPVNVKLGDTFDQDERVEIALRSEAFTGQVVGIRVLNGPGQFDVVSMSSPASRAQALYIGSSETEYKGPDNDHWADEGQFVDGSIYNTDQCMCPISLGCLNTSVGPKLVIKKSSAIESAVPPLVAGGATVYVRMNFYICYDDATLNNPDRLCSPGLPYVTPSV